VLLTTCKENDKTWFECRSEAKNRGENWQLNKKEKKKKKKRRQILDYHWWQFKLYY
jgi:hypothetical protein